VTGTLDPAPTVVTVQPAASGDAARDVPQRVFFPVGATITPNLTVALSDQTLVGYVTKGESTPLPPGMTVRYSSDHLAPSERSPTARSAPPPPARRRSRRRSPTGAGR
jgi:beta-glucosidase